MRLFPKVPDPAVFSCDDGAQLSYRLRRGAGPILVLAHPHSGTMSGFAAVLSRYGGPVLIWDRRGYGQSTRGAYAESQGADLSALLAHLNIARAVFVGVAAGGACLVEFARRSPSSVLGLGFACSFLGQPARDWFALTQEDSPQGTCEERELSDVFRSTNAAQHWRRQEAENQRRNAGEPAQFCPADPAALTDMAPLCIATGARDRLFTPAMLAQAKQRYPQAKTHLFAHAAHAPHVEDPDAFSTWLSDLVSRV
ncbi:Putative aminoacrylate hydrolase RutD [Aquimixticola soesokkakensis]|uniref:Putative aminoacrylate hydrolase RutD n=1 Tax=Aquimixticola soesokkakensis TaxID=1519096 RepID=A0A1Y5RRK6_9RHOB|nr:alpha/beta hydrolase [Aquimixticola soesokkakensis]SLN22648.1 Putative aminoacrylate hydrolase RutD [Aquimixticola soesokkakensis]